MKKPLWYNPTKCHLSFWAAILDINCCYPIFRWEKYIRWNIFEESLPNVVNFGRIKGSNRGQVFIQIQRVKERYFIQTEWRGKYHFFLLLSVPRENECKHKTIKTIGPAARATRQFIREMTFLMRNTCWRRTKGLVWAERCSCISSEVHEKVISFTRHTLSTGISSDSRCCPVQMLNKWNKRPKSWKKKIKSNSREFYEFCGQEDH